MTKQEFIERTHYWPTDSQFEEINNEYMDSDLEKDAFCRRWVRKGNIQSYSRSNEIKIGTLQYELENERHFRMQYEDELNAAYMEIARLKRKINQIKETVQEAIG